MINYKPNKIRTVVFKPNSLKRVIARYNTKTDKFIFKSCDGKEYRWVAELKFEHSQRVVQKLADELSRVGLTESEWLRLFGG